MLGRDVVAVGATGRRGRWRPAATSSPHQSARFGGTWMPTSGISRRASAISRFMSSIVDRARPRRAAAARARRRRRRCASSRARPRRRSRPAPGRSSAGAGTKFWRITSWMWPCSRVQRGERLERVASRSCSVSPMPTRMPLVNGILSSPAARIVSRRRAGCFVGEPAWTVSIRRSETDSSISPCEAVTSRRRARSSRASTPRFVCGSRPRSSARSHAQTT